MAAILPTKLTHPFTPGRHKLTLRLELPSDLPADAGLNVELKRPADAAIQFDGVGGQ